MNQLQLVLLTLAAVLLLALYLWGKWQERRALRQFEASLQTGVGDALMNTPATAQFSQVLKSELRHTQRREPTFAAAPNEDEATSEPLASITRDEAAAETEAPPSAPTPEPTQSTDIPEWIEDPLLDGVIELRCAHAVDGVGVFDAATPLGQAQLPLPVHLVVWDARTERWVRPDRFGFYSELLVAVQLAHRHAQLSQIEVARFLSAVEQVAVRLDADFDAPEATHIQKLSEQLAQTCARFDVQVGMTLQSTAGPWDAANLAQTLSACGMTRTDSNPSRWRYLNAQGRVQFSLTRASPLADKLSLELDVPTVSMDADPLRQMFGVAQQLSVNLQASLVDDNGRIIDAAALSAIEMQLQSLLAEMRTAGIEPGSPRALRLYGPLN